MPTPYQQMKIDWINAQARGVKMPMMATPPENGYFGLLRGQPEEYHHPSKAPQVKSPTARSKGNPCLI